MGITRVYISNPANCDTRAHGYQPASVDRQMMEVDDMASMAIREPSSSPSQMTAVMKKVQTIIRRCMVSIEGHVPCSAVASRRRPREHVPDRGARGVKRGARRYLGRGAGAGHVGMHSTKAPHVDSDPTVVEMDMPSYSLGLTPDPQSLPSGSGTSEMPPAPSLGFAAFQSPYSSAYGFPGVRAPPPPGTAGSSTPHQPISQASSSDEEEGQDALGRGHRVGRKPCDSRHPTGISCKDIVFIRS
ncbi:hypothetical protein M9H77_26501 [Catharanthus roseus]|uniref:Uncharacterized protein n=1 Tax=Catharanthus roseus TaxID=4058 RepID=A0ACC0ACJ2_CATRO|nr:hypothetical protein M9H77_26501 [Catharanthus roseus]